MTEPTEKLRLGGMALRNGLLVHGPTHWAAAVRNARLGRGRGRVGGASRACTASTACRACAASCAWARRWP